MLRIFVVIMAVSLPLSAVVAGERQVLSGNASGDLPPGEYVVRSAVVVRKGEAFRVQAGTTLYFEQLAGITVFGELSVDGELYDPVVLTSVGGDGDDGAGQGFHWNGIEAAGAEAVVRMRQARVSNSVYGVNVKDFGAKADLADVVFDNNGYASLVIGGQEVPVAAGEPVSVLWEMGAKVSDMPAAKSGKDGKQRAESRRRLALRGGALGVAAVGAILCGVNAVRARGDFKNYTAEDDPYKSSVYREDAKRSMAVGGIGAAIAGAGLLCVGLTVFF